MDELCFQQRMTAIAELQLQWELHLQLLSVAKTTAHCFVGLAEHPIFRLAACCTDLQSGAARLIKLSLAH